MELLPAPSHDEVLRHLPAPGNFTRGPEPSSLTGGRAAESFKAAAAEFRVPPRRNHQQYEEFSDGGNSMVPSLPSNHTESESGSYNSDYVSGTIDEDGNQGTPNLSCSFRRLRSAALVQDAAVQLAGRGSLDEVRPDFWRDRVSVTRHPGPNVVLGVCRHKGRREYMEDRHTVLQDFRPTGRPSEDGVEDSPPLPDGVNRFFAAIYDGHVGFKGAEMASDRLHKILSAEPMLLMKFSTYEEQDEAMSEAMARVFEAVDAEIVSQAIKEGKDYGTTAVVAVQLGDMLYIAHAGDAGAVLCRNGIGVKLTKSHKPDVPEECERIESRGGFVHTWLDGTPRVLANPMTQQAGAMTMLNISRTLGDPGYKRPERILSSEPDVVRLHLQRGVDQALVLGSDGLFDILNEGQIARLVKRTVHAYNNDKDPGEEHSKHSPSRIANAAAQKLVKRVLENRGSDNVTVVVALFGWHDGEKTEQ